MGKRIELTHVYRPPTVFRPPTKKAKAAPVPAAPRPAGKAQVPVASDGNPPAKFIVIKRDRQKYNAYMRAYRAKKKAKGDHG